MPGEAHSTGKYSTKPVFVLPKIKAEPLDTAAGREYGLAGDRVATAPGQACGAQSPQEDTNFDIIFETPAADDASFTPVDIKQEIKQEVPDEILSLETSGQSVPSPTAAEAVGPRSVTVSIPGTRTGQPLQLLAIKNQLDNNVTSLLKGNQRKTPLDQVRLPLPLVIMPRDHTAFPVVTAGVRGSAVTTLFKTPNGGIRPLLLTSAVRPLPCGTTVIPLASTSTLNPKPTDATQGPSIPVIAKVRVPTGSVSSGLRRKQVCLKSVTDPENSSVAGCGASSSSAAGQTSAVHNPQAPQASFISVRSSTGSSSAEHSATRALRSQMDPNLSQAAARSLVFLPVASQARTNSIPIVRHARKIIPSPPSIRPVDFAARIPNPSKVAVSTVASLYTKDLVDVQAQRGAATLVNESGVPMSKNEEFGELIEFEPDIFDVDSESLDNRPVLDYPAERDDADGDGGTGRKMRRRGSRKRVVQQPPAILPPPSLTPNGISQSGLVRSANGTKRPRGRSTGEYICEFDGCGKIFIRRQNLRDHWRVHTNDRPYKCKFCTKAFKQASHVIDHQRLHTNVKPFLCRVCGAGFVQAGQLMNHIRKHTIDKRRPFKCPQCPFGAARQDDIDAHVRESHVQPTLDDSMRSPLDCSLCIYRAATQADLDEHMGRHVHLRKFACPHCKYRAHTKSRLDIHLMLHTGEKPHPCEVCGRRFRQKSQMETHCATQHPGYVNMKKVRRGRSAVAALAAAAAAAVKGNEEDDREMLDVDADSAEIDIEPASDVKPMILDEVSPSKS